ncbi:RNA polymerase sigma-70 factor [Balneolales bacterium ANBcel1]|nr:RNA polymerase sigma-70 factor [Balneolales bacterium ANBcel1]
MEYAQQIEDRIRRDNSWVEGINNGDASSFEALYKHYYPQLGRFLLRYVQEKQVAEDIIHNVLYEIWKNRNRLEARGTLRSYLYTAVRNQALKYLKKEKGHLHVDVVDHPEIEHNPDYRDEDIEFVEFREAVRNALALIPEQRRNIFLMHREDQLTYREIAETLGISIKTVETQMSRTLKFLHKKLAHFK